MASRAPIFALSDEQIRARVARARTDSEQMLVRIRLAKAAGNQLAVTRHTERFLRSFDSRLVAAADAQLALIARVKRNATRNPSGARRSNSVPSLTEVLGLAETINMWAPTNELATQVDIAKPNGGRRRLTILRRDRLARSYLLKRLLTATTQLHPGQLATSPEGLAGAHRRVIDILSDPRIKHVAMADIRTFYDNIDTTRLGRILGIPQIIVDNNVSYQTMQIVAHGDQDSSAVSENLANEEERPGAVTGLGLLEVGRRTNAYDLYGDEVDVPVRRHSVSLYMHVNDRRGTGIPQGAPSSTIIGEIVVKHALVAVPSNVIPVSWIDNVYQFGASRAEVNAAAETLRSTMLEAPTGPFLLRDESIRRVADGFEALGGWFRRQRGHVTFRPTHANLRCHQVEVTRYLAVIAQTGRGVREAQAYIRGWCEAFSQWPGAARLRRLELGFVNEVAQSRALYFRCDPTPRFARFLGIDRLLTMPCDLSILWSPPPITGVSSAARSSGQ